MLFFALNLAVREGQSVVERSIKGRLVERLSYAGALLASHT